MFSALVALLWRLLPIAIVVYGVRDGAETGREVIKSATDVVRQMQAFISLRGAASSMKLAVTAGDFEAPDDFTEYMRNNLTVKGGDAGLDPWGQEFELLEEDDHIILFSCGPDTECENEDDIRVIVTL